MSNAVVSNIGQAAASGSTTALFLKVFSEDPVNFPGCGATHIVQIAAPRTADL